MRYEYCVQCVVTTAGGAVSCILHLPRAYLLQLDEAETEMICLQISWEVRLSTCPCSHVLNGFPGSHGGEIFHQWVMACRAGSLTEVHIGASISSVLTR